MDPEDTERRDPIPNFFISASSIIFNVILLDVFEIARASLTMSLGLILFAGVSCNLLATQLPLPMATPTLTPFITFGSE